MNEQGYVPVRPEGTFVYKVFDAARKLLYVGVTDDLCSRMAGHRQTSLWWQGAAHIEWELFPDRRSALKEESLLIRRLDPPQNTAGRTRWRAILTEDPNWHVPGCEVGAVLAYRRLFAGGT